MFLHNFFCNLSPILCLNMYNESKVYYSFNKLYLIFSVNFHTFSNNFIICRKLIMMLDLLLHMQINIPIASLSAHFYGKNKNIN